MGAFSTSKRTTEFEKAEMNSARIPGPAEYTRVEKKKGGQTFGVKREQPRDNNPGPG